MVTILNYKLSRKNRELPFQQEMFKRQVDGFMDVVHCVREIADGGLGYARALALRFQKTYSDAHGTRFAKGEEELRLAVAKYLTVLPDGFITKVREFQAMMDDLVVHVLEFA